MRIAVYFVFIPTAVLLEAAAKAGEETLIELSVWTTHEHDRTGLEHSQQEVERAFWSEFRALLFRDDETVAHRQFRERCNELGLSGCFSVIKTSGGGLVKELIVAAREADEFLKKQEGSD